MSEEEIKEYYEELKSLLYTGNLSQAGKRKLIEIIEKQQEQLQEKDKIIDLMAKYIAGCDTDEDICKKWKQNNSCEDNGVSCKECLIEYFINKAREV